jgi:hypothetical protein
MNEYREPRHFPPNEEERDELQLLRRILRLLEFPHATAFQVGDDMAIGSIAPGTTGQFAGVITFPAGVTAPAGYNPTLNWSSPDPLITFAPATTDATNGAVPLANQVVATVASSDTAANGSVGFAFLGTDGVTVISSNVVSFTIPQVAPPPPVEPTGVASQVA